MAKEDNLKCWKRVPLLNDTFACNERWISVTPLKKGGFAVDTIKDGIIEILAYSETREQAEKIRYDYMKRNDKVRKIISMEEFIQRKNKGEFNT